MRLSSLLALVAIVLGACLWMLHGSVSEAGAAEPAGSPAVTPNKPTTTLTLAASGPGLEAREVLRQVVPSEAPAPPVDPQEDNAALYRVVLFFVRGNSYQADPQSLHVTLTRESDGERVVLRGQTPPVPSLELTPRPLAAEGRIGLGRWRVEVLAPGYDHIPIVHDFSNPERRIEVGWWRGPPAFVQRIFIWDDAQIPVVVRTRDGRPFFELARERGLQTRRYFRKAFDVQTSRVPFDPGVDPRVIPAEAAPAVFHPPGGPADQNDLGAIAGFLEVAAPGAFWARLLVFDGAQEPQLVPAGASEVLFEIDMETLRERFGSVRVTLVDRESGQPVTDAVGNLKADLSAHRREDLSKVRADDRGRMRFDDVIPGKHDLIVTGTGSSVQRKLVIEPGQDLDLGVIELDGGPALQVRVVGSNGKPVQSWIEVAPYEPGAHVGDLYHPNLHRITSKDGRYKLPWPDRRSIIRARPYLDPESRPVLDPRRNLRGPSPVFTRSVLIDPERRVEELVLHAHLPVATQLEPDLAWGPAHALAFENGELNLIVKRIHTPRRPVALVPGPYLVKRWHEGKLIDSADVVVGSQPATLRVP